MAYQIQKLRRFINTNRALANVPFGTVRGRSITPREALAMLQRGEAVSEVVAAMAATGMDPPQQDWVLVEDYYRRLLALPGPKPSIYVIAEGDVVGQEIPLAEALTHVRARDAIGRGLLSSYQGLLREMARRMR